MFLEKLVKNNYSEFPGFDLVGYCELCIPMFKRILHCSMVSKKRLAVVDEFVLRYSTLDLSLMEISKLMGLPLDLVEQAWYNLLSRELIDRFNNLTDKGREYLELFKLDNFEILEVKVAINGLNGDIELDNSNLMTSKALRESGLKSVKPLIDLPNIGNIDLRKLKQAIKTLKKPREENEESELIGLHHVVDQATNYKRLFLLIFADKEMNLRFMVFDGWQRIKKYEEHLLELESSGSQIIKLNMENYFQSYKPRLIQNMSDRLKEQSEMNIGMLSEEWDKLIKSAKSKIIISIPLIDLCDLSDSLIDNITKCLERGVEVEIYVTGREFNNSFQKKQSEKLLSYRKLIVANHPYYDSKILLVDDESAVVSDFKKTEINLPCSKVCYAEYGYKINDTAKIMIVSEWIKQYKKVFPQISEDISNEWVKQKMLNIVRLYYQFDERLKLSNGVGWLADDPIPDVQKLVNSDLVTNEVQYKEVFNTMNQSLVESIENVWKRHGMKGYFWGEFKSEYPDLQKTLHKIKLYRHSTHHLSLDDRNKVTYYKFLDEDLGGSMPMFVENGYQRIQIKILESLESELIKLCI